MNRREFVILNPCARSQRARGFHSRIQRLARHAQIHTASSAQETRELARKASRENYRCVVAAGGDGTINAVVNGLAGSRMPLGILPVGTMNVFATELGLPQGRLREAWEIIEQGATREVDLPRAGGRYFVQLAGAGLDAEVVRRTAPESKDFLGPLSYLLTLAQVAGGRSPEIRVATPDGRERSGSFVLVGNGRHYGGPFVLFQDARLDDRRLDVLVFKNQGPWDLLRYMQAIAVGALPGLPDVEYFQAEEVRLTASGPVPFELDGEVSGELPTTLAFARTRLRVIAPAK